jgi:nicotinate-nucleotide adenylyltransferase
VARRRNIGTPAGAFQNGAFLAWFSWLGPLYFRATAGYLFPALVALAFMDAPVKSLMRIGIMGGSFDPIHRGHLMVAEAARTAMHFHKIIFVTAHCPPHKSVVQLTPVEHRHAMVELAVKDTDYFETSRVEAERSCPTYVGDTIRHFKQQLKNTAEVFFITGLDALLAIVNQGQSRTYPGICHFVAATRPGYEPEKVRNGIPDDFFPHVTILEEPCLSISSTDIRSRVKARQSIEGMVPDAVRQYIYRHSLYRN